MPDGNSIVTAHKKLYEKMESIFRLRFTQIIFIFKPSQWVVYSIYIEQTTLLQDIIPKIHK